MFPLPWLRTLFIDLRCVAAGPPCQAALHESNHSHRQFFAIEKFVVKDNREDGQKLLSNLPRLVRSLRPFLTSVDLSDCSDANALSVVEELLKDDDGGGAASAAGRLRRLFLPWKCSISQQQLEFFSNLEVLQISGCSNLVNVSFCGTTLRVLYADACLKLNDAGLQHATRLEILHVSGCGNIQTVEPFGHRLHELDASDGCGIDSEALSQCHRLQVLAVSYNEKFKTLGSYAPQLRELVASGPYCISSDRALAAATRLVRLDVSGNPNVTTVEPFGASLRVLGAQRTFIDDKALVTATKLVELFVWGNREVRSIAPFASTLMELDASGDCGIDDASLAAVSSMLKLIWLNVSDNPQISTVASCAHSLRHLSAQGDSGLTMEGLTLATQLVSYDCSYNPNLSKIQPFAASLEWLVALGARCGLLGSEIGTAALLRVVCFFNHHAIDPQEHLVPFGFEVYDAESSHWCRNS